jgi:hypothetical protein
LTGAWFQPLHLKCDILVSIFAFQMQLNLHRYATGHGWANAVARFGAIAASSMYSMSAVGLALFTLFSPELGLWVGTFHIIQSRTRVMGWQFSRSFAVKTHATDDSQSM